MAALKIVEKMNKTHSEKQIKYLKEKLKNMGEKAIFDSYTKEWKLVW